jgi:hypothetical protein
MAAVLQAGPVADITIEDPPLEEVIAHIYGQAADTGGQDDTDEDEVSDSETAPSPIKEKTLNDLLPHNVQTESEDIEK